MANLRKTLNNLSQLVTFEAACRNINFTHAANELGVTRVSVSRQISELEEVLGVQLFHRRHRQVELTERGRMLATQVNPALYQIADALNTVRETETQSRLSVTMSNAFATYWLMPRLAKLKIAHPEVDLNLVISDQNLDLDTENIDIAIRYASKPVFGNKVTRLMQEVIFPVMSPNYKPRTALETVADLRSEHLLHLAGNYRPGARWPSWFRKNGSEPPPANNGVMVNTYLNMFQAALEGQGIALTGNPLVDPFIESGQLIAPPHFQGVERHFYYLIDRTEHNPHAAVFCAWLMKECAF